MFTGIIETVGTVVKNRKKTGIYNLDVEAGNFSKTLKEADSIAVNGVCLTLTGKTKSVLHFDVISKTAELTNLSMLNAGDFVNMENSLTLSKLISGHLVTGHIDGTGTILEIKKFQEQQIGLLIKASPEILKFIANKASIALDGVSLTVGKKESNGFWVYIIPFTFNNTVFKKSKEGRKVNIEIDIIMRYLDCLTKTEKEKGKDLLKKYGFIG